MAAQVKKRRASGGLASENPKNIIYSIAKAFKVFEAFDTEHHSLTISEVAERAETDRGTAFRIIRTLVALGYMQADSQRRFRLTFKCLELGFRVLSAQSLPSHARPLLRACVPDLVDAASLGSLEGADVIYLERTERSDAAFSRLHLDFRPGRRFRAYASALGHCMLAFLPEPTQIEILESAERLKLSEQTLVDLDSLLSRLREVKTRGYAISDGENAYGLRTVATPVFDRDGNVVAGVSLTVDSNRISIKTLIKIGVPKALEIADELSRVMKLWSGAVSLKISN